MPIQLHEKLTGTAAIFRLANNTPVSVDVAEEIVFLDHAVAIHNGLQLNANHFTLRAMWCTPSLAGALKSFL
eukprot:5416780-Amphidinium_carterae.3